MGVFRVVVGTALVEHPELIEQFLKEFGSRKIAVAIESSDGRIIIDGRKKLTDVDPIEHALRMKKLGVSRIVFYSIHPETKEEIFDFEALKKMARKTMVRITSGGGISNYKELIKAQELEKYGVDSVIIGKALYENNFPCQRLWRLNEKLLTELGPTRRI
jgi:phosphoribosylformimino-5-aminoimidazole carboxamide ribotide isomerase